MLLASALAVGAATGTLVGERAATPQARPVDGVVEGTVSTGAVTGALPPTLGAADATLGLDGAPRDVADLIERSLPSIVRIGARTPRGFGNGTGFVISSDGKIATNAHVVAGASEVYVEFADGAVAEAVVLGAAPNEDLAVVQVRRTDLVPLPVGSSDDLRVGEQVVAIGNALGLDGGHTATDGIVSALDREITTQDGGHLDGLIQTDAAINPGNSGGPLLTLDGRVVGINSAGTRMAQNIGFAIGIDNARPILDALATGPRTALGA